MGNEPTKQNARDFLARARALYNHQRVTAPDRTLRTREVLRQGLANPAGVEPRRLAEAWSLYGEILMCDYLNRWNAAGQQELAEAESAVEHALQVAPDLPQAHYASGLVYRAKGEHHQSLAAFTQTIALNPNIPLAHAQRGAELLYIGKPEEALRPIATALEISRPDSPSRGMFYWYLGRTHFFAGDYYAAIPWLRKSVELRRNLWYNRAYHVSACALDGDWQAAETALRDFYKAFPGYTLARIVSDEQTNPNDNDIVVEGRRRFHEGLLKAGMKEI